MENNISQCIRSILSVNDITCITNVLLGCLAKIPMAIVYIQVQLMVIFQISVFWKDAHTCQDW
jgi:hypothetical protein